MTLLFTGLNGFAAWANFNTRPPAVRTDPAGVARQDRPHRSGISSAAPGNLAREVVFSVDTSRNWLEATRRAQFQPEPARYGEDELAVGDAGEDCAGEIKVEFERVLSNAGIFDVPAAARGKTEKRIAVKHLMVSSSLALVPSPSF